MRLLGGVERHSEHPLGQAVCRHIAAEGISPVVVEDFAMLPGQGVSARAEGMQILCGNERLLERAGLSLTPDITESVAALRDAGKAIILVATPEEILGVVGLSDALKENASAAISALPEAGITEAILLTGDNERSAAYMAERVGIHQVEAALLPEEKLERIAEMMQTHDGVCMVGDGVNDAPALKAASVGIAMGTMGSEIAIDAADIAILGDDISKISYIKKLSNATVFSIKFNISLSMAINLVAIVLSVMGILTPATGALVHNAGSVLVVLNAARLYDKKIV